MTNKMEAVTWLTKWQRPLSMALASFIQRFYMNITCLNYRTFASSLLREFGQSDIWRRITFADTWYHHLVGVSDNDRLVVRILKGRFF